MEGAPKGRRGPPRRGEPPRLRRGSPRPPRWRPLRALGAALTCGVPAAIAPYGTASNRHFFKVQPSREAPCRRQRPLAGCGPGRAAGGRPLRERGASPSPHAARPCPAGSRASRGSQPSREVVPLPSPALRGNARPRPGGEVPQRARDGGGKERGATGRTLRRLRSGTLRVRLRGSAGSLGSWSRWPRPIWVKELPSLEMPGDPGGEEDACSGLAALRLPPVRDVPGYPARPTVPCKSGGQRGPVCGISSSCPLGSLCPTGR